MAIWGTGGGGGQLFHFTGSCKMRTVLEKKLISWNAI